MPDAASVSHACPACDATEQAPLYDVNGYAIVRCCGCGHGYVAQMPTAEELDELYSSPSESFLGSGFAGPMAAYLGDDDRRFFAYYASRLTALRRSGAKRDARILDFACSQGAFVTTLVRKGFTNVVGFDLSADSVSQGKERWGLDLRSGELDSFVATNDGAFDVVHAADVLEHVPDPRSLVRAFRRLLRRGGTLIVSVPNSRSAQVIVAGTRSPVVDPPHHLQYFGPKSLERVIASGDFRVTRMVTEFWEPASDLYLNMKGVPLAVARAIRMGMRIPGFALNTLRLGGIISVLAR